MERNKKTRLIAILVGATSLVVAFAGAFGLHRWGDDWGFVHYVSQGDLFRLMTTPHYQHWSPLWFLTEWVSFKLVGWNSDAFIRPFIVVTRVGSLFAVWWATSRFRIGGLGAVVAIGVIGLHHAQGASIYSFDTYPQCASDLLGWTGAIAFLTALSADRPIRTKSYWAALTLLLVAFLYKEQGLAAAAICVVFAVVHYADTKNWKRWVNLATRVSLPVVVLVVGFAFTRAASGRFLETTERFAITLSAVPKNVTQLSLGLFSPARTLEWFDELAVPPRDYAWLAVLVVVTLLFIGVMFLGATRRIRQGPESHKHFWMLVGALFASYFPVALMGKVGELYIHSSLFWFALLAGYCVDGWTLRTAGAGKPARGMLTVGAAIYLLVLGLGLRANLADARATSDQAAVWTERMAEALDGVPPGSRVLVYNHNPERLPNAYGLYRRSTPYAFLLEGTGQESLLYLTDSQVHFYQVKEKPVPDLTTAFPDARDDSPLLELHIRGESITLSPVETEAFL